MGVPVLIMGESGSGKSTGLRNFEPNEIGIFNVAGKPLPFRKKMRIMQNASYQQIQQSLIRPNLNAYIIDDSQALMAFAMFNRAKEKGYDKFTEIAVDFYNLVQTAIKMPPDCIVYFLHHVEQTDTGKIKAKTIGKMLDQQLSLEGLFSVVLLCKTDGKRHWFETQSDGFTTAKSPMEMFEENEIDNDLKLVDSKIREYWNLRPLINVAQVQQQNGDARQIVQQVNKPAQTKQPEQLVRQPEHSPQTDINLQQQQTQQQIPNSKQSQQSEQSQQQEQTNLAILTN